MPAKCPNCGELAIKPHSPFCSERCASVDLGNWFSGKYTFPADDIPAEDELDAIIDSIEAGAENGGEDADMLAKQSAAIMPFQRK